LINGSSPRHGAFIDLSAGFDSGRDWLVVPRGCVAGVAGSVPPGMSIETVRPVPDPDPVLG
jgi:hypothetical protein